MSILSVFQQLIHGTRSKEEILKYLGEQQTLAIKELENIQPSENQVGKVMNIFQGQSGLEEKQIENFMQNLAASLCEPSHKILMASLYKVRNDIARLPYDDYSQVLSVNNILHNYWNNAANTQINEKFSHIRSVALITKQQERLGSQTPMFVARVIEE